MNETSRVSQRRSAAWPCVWLLGLALVQAAVYGVIAWLSPAFDYFADVKMRPIPTVLLFFWLAFLLYLCSLALAVRCTPGKRLFWAVLGPALLFRAILLFSTPIQEIDIYRYIWDGAVAAEGVSPFRYPPAQVGRADLASTSDDQLRLLVELRHRSTSLDEILQRVHFGELPTVYPPVSQAVFAVANSITPDSATIYQRVIIMKAVLLVFDVGTILVVWQILSLAGRHSGWAVAYAWCPLVLKEFANSGHLDAVAVFLATASVWLAAKMLIESNRRQAFRLAMAAAILLALSVGAKLFAITLLPLAAICWSRLGALRAGLACSSVVIASGVLLLPMLASESSPPVEDRQTADVSTPIAAPSQLSEVQQPDANVDPLSGLQAFLSRWEMNDFLFLIAVENIRPRDPSGHWPEAWFAVVPESWRLALVNPMARWIGGDTHQAVFLAARILTSGLFVVIALALAWRVLRDPSAKRFLEAAFLTVAWFWLLSPTQNPWYWTWALPLVPFARGRAWLALSGLVFVYYLRFWLEYHFAGIPLAGTPYRGVEFFDLVITWAEYAPWLALLFANWVVQNPRNPR